MSSVLFICSALTLPPPVTADYYSPTVTSVPLPQSHQCQSCAGETPTSPSRKISSEARYYNALTTESCIHQMDTSNLSTLNTYTLQIKAISQSQRGGKKYWQIFFFCQKFSFTIKASMPCFENTKLFNFRINNSCFNFLASLLFYIVLNYRHWYYLFTILKYHRFSFKFFIKAKYM